MREIKVTISEHPDYWMVVSSDGRAFQVTTAASALAYTQNLARRYTSVGQSVITHVEWLPSSKIGILTVKALTSK